mmetsp:Transcript_15150/g.44833  ORF Transcript_15150/g.44833 Transcript_15150/m.44833 type:complete len:247 (-) Transcript_15150:279-1019(-)
MLGAEHVVVAVVDIGSGHVLVQTLDGRGRVRGPPVRHDPAFKAHGGFEVLGKELGVLAGIGAIHLVVAAHGGGDARVDAGLERRVVDFKQGSGIGDDRVHNLTIVLLVVQGEVLHHSEHAFVLEPLHIRGGELRPKERVLSRQILGVPPPTCDAVHIHCWAKHHVRALRKELVRGGRRPLRHQGRVPGTRQPQTTAPRRDLANLPRVHRAEPLAGILKVQRRNPEPRHCQRVPNVPALHRVPTIIA